MSVELLSDQSGLWYDGAWVVQETARRTSRDYSSLFGRPVEIDVENQRVLTYTDKGKRLCWLRVPDATEIEEVTAGEETRAWAWFNWTQLPKTTGAWTLTEQGRQRWETIRQQRVAEFVQAGRKASSTIPTYSADLQGVQRFQDGQWNTLDQELYGTSVWEDGADGVWLIGCNRVTVCTPEGVQEFPIDAVLCERCRLAVESPDAVWIASIQSLTRFVRQEVPGQSRQWVQDRCWRLPATGIRFEGPWIAGPNLYYVSNGALYHVSIPTLLGE